MVPSKRIHSCRLFLVWGKESNVLSVRVDYISSLPHKRKELPEGHWGGVDGLAEPVLKRWGPRIAQPRAIMLTAPARRIMYNGQPMLHTERIVNGKSTLRFIIPFKAFWRLRAIIILAKSNRCVLIHDDIMI